MKVFIIIMMTVVLISGITTTAYITAVEDDLVTVVTIGNVWNFYGDGFEVGQIITVEFDWLMRIIDAY